MEYNFYELRLLFFFRKEECIMRAFHSNSMSSLLNGFTKEQKGRNKFHTDIPTGRFKPFGMSKPVSLNERRSQKENVYAFA